MASGVSSSLRCAGFSLWRLLLLQSTGSRHVGFSSCGTWAQQLRLTGSRAQAQQLWHMGLVAPGHVGSSGTRARTRLPCIGRRILNHCATREVLYYCCCFSGKPGWSNDVADLPLSTPFPCVCDCSMFLNQNSIQSYLKKRYMKLDCKSEQSPNASGLCRGTSGAGSQAHAGSRLGLRAAKGLPMVGSTCLPISALKLKNTISIT